MRLSKWSELGEDLYVGKTIIGIRYLSKEEADQLGLYQRAPVLKLSNGVEILPLQDDECNSAGALGQLFYFKGERKTGQYVGSVLPTASLNHEEYEKKLYANETGEKRRLRDEAYCLSVKEECRNNSHFGTYTKAERGYITLHVYDTGDYQCFNLRQNPIEEPKEGWTYWGEVEVNKRNHSLLEDEAVFLVGVADEAERKIVGDLIWAHSKFSMERIFLGGNMIEEHIKDEYFLVQLNLLKEKDK